MSTAAKLKKKAAEFEQKKQFDKALQLYVQILDESAGDDDAEGDVALYNRVGDLLMRQGSVGDAMTYYEKAVDLYAESGFFNNAIALCNKILRQSPGRNSIYYKLGKISAKKGFISDAKQNFLEYASRMQTGGQLDEAFRALKEFADLCPDQDDIRLMLADQLSKKDRKGEALEQLQLLYEKFEVEGRGADMRATVDRMKAIDPAAEPKTGGGQRSQKSTDLVFLDLSDGEPVKPHKGAKAAPPPPAPRGAAGPKARQSGGTSRTSRTSGPGRVAADPGPMSRVSAPIPEQPQTTGDYAAVDPMMPSPSLASASDDGLVSDSPTLGPPDHVQGFMSADTASPDDLLAPVTLPGFEPSALDAELNLAFGDGLPGLPGVEPPLSGEQFASLRLATPLDSPLISPHPHDLALPGELPELGGASATAVSFTGEMELIIPEDDAEFASNAPAPAPVGAGRNRAGRPAESRVSDESARDLTAPPPTTDRSSDIDLPMLDVDLAALDAEPAADERAQAIGDPLGLVGGAEVLDVSDLGAEPPGVADDVEATEATAGDGTDEPSPDMWDSTGAPARRATDDAESDDGIDLPAWMDGAEAKPRAPIERVEDPEPPVQRPRRVSTPVAGAAAAASDAPPAAGDSSRRPSQSALARSMEALRSRSEASPADWSLRRQLAEALFEEGDREAGLRELEAAMIGLERTQDLDGARSVADEIIRLNPNSVRHHQKRVEYAFRTNDRSRLPEAYLELADALFRSGQADKARAVYHRVLELAPQDPRAQAALSTFGDLPGEPPPPPSAPARKSRGSGSGTRRKSGGAPARRRGDPPPVDVSATADSASGFVNLGDWLRDDEAPKSTRLVIDDEEPTGDEEADFADMLRRFKRGIAENVSDEDHESHYDLGVAYKEMGLVDEAISEFQKALRAPSHRVRTFEALGQCFIEKQQFQVATTILGRALNEPSVTDDQLVGVLYLLGYACEALMRWEAAIGYYQRVFGVDIQFRDTAQRLTMLERAPR